MTIELGTVPGGYGWVFPKGDHLNVGVGGWAAQGPLLRDHLATLCDRTAWRPTTSRRCAATDCRCAARWGTTARGRAAVVGDAAGLVDPLSGDGMFEAFLSSKLASEAALDVLAGRAAGHGALRRTACSARSRATPRPPGRRSRCSSGRRASPSTGCARR